MPPIKRYEREDIIEIVCKMVEHDGLKAINARSVAKELNASVQVIYHNFDTIEELINEVIKEIYQKYKDYLIAHDDKEKPYLAKGMAYVSFAKYYPEFFKILYMSSYDISANDLLTKDKETDDIIKETIAANFKLSKNEEDEFHKTAWIFAHGIACLIATSTISFDEDEIRNLLMNTIQKLYVGFNERR